MTIAYAVVAAFLVCFSVMVIRVGVRQWTGAGRPLSYWLRNTLLDAESRAGYDRGSLLLGVSTTFLAILLACTAISRLLPKHEARWALLGGLIALTGALVSVGLFLSIIGFNRPRFLVPPHRRGELGSIAGRRRTASRASAHDVMRIDILFQNVQGIELPTVLPGLRVSEKMR